MADVGLSLKVISNQNSIVTYQERNLENLRHEIENFVMKLDIPSDILRILENVDNIFNKVNYRK